MSEVLRQLFNEGSAYFFLYLYLAATVLVEAALSNVKLSRTIARASTAILILFIGLRWQTGTDWLAYFNIFYTNAGSADYDIATFGIDSGYLWLNKIVFLWIGDYSAFLLIDATIAIIAVYIFIERSTTLPNVGVYLFYTSYAITHFMGSNRRMLAIGMVCLGFLFLMQRRSIVKSWLRWAVPFGLATLFHRTSALALPSLIISRRAWPAVPVIIGLCTCVGLGMSGAPFAGLEAVGAALSGFSNITIIDKLLFYTSGSESQSAADFDVMGQALLGVVKRSTVLAIFIAFMAKGKPSEYAQRLYNLYVVGCATYFLMIGSPVFQVASTYYTIVEIALMPIIFSQVPQFKVPYLIYLMTMPFLLMASALSPYIELYIPYRSIFSTY